MTEAQYKSVTDMLETVFDLLGDINVGECSVVTTETVLAAVDDTLRDIAKELSEVKTTEETLVEFCRELCGKLYDHDMHAEEEKLLEILKGVK